MNEIKTIYELINPNNESKILGPNNATLNLIEEVIGCEIYLSHGAISIKNKDEIYQDIIIRLISLMEKLLNHHIALQARDVVNLIQSVQDNKEQEIFDVYVKKEMIVMMNNGRAIYPKSLNQAAYVQAFHQNDIIFGVGPAGTGKTFLAVLYAVAELRKNNIKKIVLVRPVVEAGERLGFLPGDVKEKIDPYLIPLYDALNDCLGKESVNKLIEKGVIEIAPLAYMRGRTLDNAIVILDEAQNATKVQMKMFLTRLGFNSKMIITGDITQIDLPSKLHSGLIEAISLFNDLKGVAIVYFNKHDVMRHPLVYKIIKRYEGVNDDH